MNPRRLGVGLIGDPPTMTIELWGELTSLTETALLEAYQKATARGAGALVIDFTRVELMNSAGISLLFGILTSANKLGQHLRFVGLNPHYQKVLTMMGFARFADISS